MLTRTPIRCAFVLAMLFALLAGSATTSFAGGSSGVGTDLYISVDGSTPQWIEMWLDFGDVPVGQSKTITCTVYNMGKTTMSVLQFGRLGGAWVYSAGTLGKSLAPGASGTFSVTFRPSQTGLYDPLWSVQWREGNVSYYNSLGLMGTGI